ncbi:hypothetical protein [Methylorubrum podarium]|jgi:hypothetical protein|uniref:Uncharacterized protein n=1 Tax=Methylorubrum podarium TaxID=200476 RepID=A0ABV1QN87_9HYPH|nr:hypothetical protein [Methylorubrum podarium]MDV2982892.1 hypothetical protein [Methylobacteriaceae bacterium AG10]GJE72287.1 hypothetical protein CHKEEEPN_3841 [Methylorubrum podarium]
MFPKLVGSLALLAAGAVLLHSWEMPRWMIAALCAIGTAATVLLVAPALEQTLVPAAVMPARERPKGPAPVFEGIWDPLDHRQVLRGSDL